jgi:hypothetical protein
MRPGVVVVVVTRAMDVGVVFGGGIIDDISTSDGEGGGDKRALDARRDRRVQTILESN